MSSNNKGRFDALKSNNNPFKNNSNTNNRFRKRNTNGNPNRNPNRNDERNTNRFRQNSRFTSLKTNDDEQSSKYAYRQKHRNKNRFKKRGYYQKRDISESVFKPSCLTNAGISALLTEKPKQQKTKKNKKKPYSESFQTVDLGDEDREYNRNFILRYQQESDDEIEIQQNKKIVDSKEQYNESNSGEGDDEEEEEEEYDELSMENYTQNYI